MDHFDALLLNRDDNGLHHVFQTLTPADLPAGDTSLEVLYSSLNFKDGLSITGTAKIARHFPMVPGIDLVGRVVESSDERLLPGQVVAINGCGIGETHWGGYTQYARVQGAWCVVLPEAISAARAAAIGTAGFTAMLAVLALERNGATPNNGPILVTGATGGVGSIAIMLLARLGYTVAASTGRSEQFGDYLTALGASELVGRVDVDALSKRPLNSRRWAAVIDNVGGDALAALLTEVEIGGSVASIGNASGVALNTTVLPFILRGVNLLGIDSNNAALSVRNTAYARLAVDLDGDKLDSITRTEPLRALPQLADDIVNNRLHGRVVIDVNQ